MVEKWIYDSLLDDLAARFHFLAQLFRERCGDLTKLCFHLLNLLLRVLDLSVELLALHFQIRDSIALLVAQS